MKRTLLLPFLALLSTALVGCGGSGSSLKWKSGDKVYTRKILFDTSAEEVPERVNFYIGKKGSVTKVAYKRNEFKFGYHSGVLTLSGKDLKEKVAPGEYDLTVTFKDGAVKVPFFGATKFIETADDFQAIGDTKESLEGYYVLVNDIDCSSIANFEPLGWYTEETDPTNAYFHGILDGNGFAVRNITCSYSSGQKGPSDSGYPSNYDVYCDLNTTFQLDAHKAGDNIGIFQVIGSAGVVKNLVFDNCKVHGRTIVGVIAGNVAGTVENCLIKANCSALMDTHFWDDDCNVGGAFGIVGGTGQVRNVVNLSTNVNVRGEYEDYGDQYVGEPGGGYDHEHEEDNFWRFWGDNKVVDHNPYRDSNNSFTNGVYAFVGKCWGSVYNSVSASFKVLPYNATTPRDAFFGQTHLGANKPTSGDSNLGSLENCVTLSNTELKAASNYSTFDTTVWNIIDGQLPSIVTNVNHYDIAQ